MIRVGTAGWSYADWQGRVYPRRKPPGFHPLSWLSNFVSAIEINSTFYALPKREHVRNWNELVASFPQVRFTAKVHRDFTHRSSVRSAPGDQEPRGPRQEQLAASEFLEALEPLRASGRLTALLLQFPHHFDRSEPHRNRLARLVELFDAMPLVLELRHRSWFEPQVLERIAAQGLSVAAIDLPFVPDHPPEDAPTVGPIGYLRLHGRNRTQWFARGATRDQRYDYLYAEDELGQLVARARRIASGTDETYVITNNHFGGQAVANAIELRARLEGRDGIAPQVLLDAFPRLRGVARPGPAESSQPPSEGPSLFDES